MKIAETTDLAACHALRRAVFIQEQNVSEAEDMDDLDDEATHLLAWDDTGRPVGTARVFLRDGVGKIGRVCVLADQRGTGLGAAIMRASIDLLRERGAHEVHLSAQTYAIGFYEKLGFVAEGPIYDDAGIPHRDMMRTI